jgi:hypothetical protein
VLGRRRRRLPEPRACIVACPACSPRRAPGRQPPGTQRGRGAWTGAKARPGAAGYESERLSVYALRTRRAHDVAGRLRLQAADRCASCCSIASGRAMPWLRAATRRLRPLPARGGRTGDRGEDVNAPAPRGRALGSRSAVARWSVA